MIASKVAESTNCHEICERFQKLKMVRAGVHEVGDADVDS
jgi:hypothetical protein